ncbi:MAG: NUDIX domain-containing protein [Bacteroidetes bacterium]|nr:MAG: NUDIX domain-containing protein [Bacteroidota bacterium]
MNVLPSTPRFKPNHMSIKIYFNDKPFIITAALDASHNRLLQTAGTIFINHPTLAQVAQCIHDIDQTPAQAVIIYTNEIDVYFSEFQRHFTPITAGGGLVANQAGAVLFMFRRGKWDLPKGKLDDGETIEACALREVHEETGLSKVTLGPHLCTTWHTYRQHQRHYLKQSVWFSMHTTGTEELVPQTEEDISELKWMQQKDWQFIYNNLFPSVKDVLAAATATTP